MKKIMLAFLTVVLLLSVVPSKSVFADGNDPIEIEFIISDGKKGAEATILFRVVDSSIYGKEIRFDIDGEKYNPNALRFELEKIPGSENNKIPEGYEESEGKKTIVLTDERQYLLIWLYDFANCEYLLFAYHVPTLSEVQ
jgi:hypothetical protein